jgi:hypothetical protein
VAEAGQDYSFVQTVAEGALNTKAKNAATARKANATR